MNTRQLDSCSVLKDALLFATILRLGQLKFLELNKLAGHAITCD